MKDNSDNDLNRLAIPYEDSKTYRKSFMGFRDGFDKDERGIFACGYRKGFGNAISRGSEYGYNEKDGENDIYGYNYGDRDDT